MLHCLPIFKGREEHKKSRGTIWKINRSINFNIFNCIYMIEYDKDKNRKIGQTGMFLKF